jgi:hypothetical protein
MLHQYELGADHAARGLSHAYAYPRTSPSEAARRTGSDTRLGFEHEQFNFDLGIEMAVGDERLHPAARQTFDSSNELVLHSVLKRATGLLQDRRALEIDHRLLDLGEDASEHAREQIIAEE